MRKTLTLLTGCVFMLCPFLFALSGCKSQAVKDSYTIRAEYFPEEGKLQAEMSVTVNNTSQNVLDEVKFQLYANAYREGAAYKPVSDNFYNACYYDGASYGMIEITSLEGGEYQVCGEDENILSVKPAKPLYPDERATVTLSYTLTLPKAAHRLGIGQNAVNLSCFYPAVCHLTESGFEEYVYSYAGDPFVSDIADYEVTMTVPEGYTLVHGGVGNSVTQNGKTTYNVIAKNVRDVAFVIGKDFECVTANENGVSVEYYYKLDKSPASTLKAAADALSYFSDVFSPYGYERYVVVESDFVFGGMEFSTLAMISNALQGGERTAAVVHETAHQWWYFKVGSNQVNESWQDEGLAEYSTALFCGEYPEYGSSYEERVRLSERAYRAYFSVYSQLGGADTRMSRPLTAYAGEYEYRCVSYDKGVVMFDRVREAMGERKFFSALKRYAKEYDKKQATRADLIACFEDTGACVEGLFNSFLDGLCVI